jgi:hypothetical protein
MAKQKNNFYSAGKALANMAAGTVIWVRPEVVKHFGSMSTAALLSRLITWNNVSKGKPFYMFTTVCGHDLYQTGRSWEEELGLSAKSIKTALNRIGYKKGEASRKKIAADIAKMKGCAATKDEVARTEKSRMKASLVVYYTDRERVTWYKVNEEAVAREFGSLALTPGGK